MVSAFACRRSVVERSAGVIAQPVLVGVTRGTEAREIPGILVASSCRKAKGSGLLSRAVGSIVIRRRRSSFLAPSAAIGRAGGGGGEGDTAGDCSGAAARKGAAPRLLAVEVGP